MQSDIRSARSDLWLCSPRTHEMASTMLDLPQPLGPIMHVSPLPLKVIWVLSQNDLNPTSSTLRNFSKISPFMAFAGRTLGRSDTDCRYSGRNGYRFLGRRQVATKSLKGRLAVAQPPGATMAVTGRKFNTRRARSKGTTAYQCRHDNRHLWKWTRYSEKTRKEIIKINPHFSRRQTEKARQR